MSRFCNTYLIAEEVMRLKKEYRLETYEAIQIIQIDTNISICESIEYIAKATHHVANVIGDTLTPELSHLIKDGLCAIADSIGEARE